MITLIHKPDAADRAIRFERMRQELWLDTVKNMARRDTCLTQDVATIWADYFVEKFDEKFKERNQ